MRLTRIPSHLHIIHKNDNLTIRVFIDIAHFRQCDEFSSEFSASSGKSRVKMYYYLKQYYNHIFDEAIFVLISNGSSSLNCGLVCVICASSESSRAIAHL